TWMRWLEAGRPSGAAGLGDRIRPMEYAEDEAGESGVSVSSRLTHGISSLAEVGTGAARSLVGLTVEAKRSTAAIAEEAARTLPRLARLGQMQSHTRISFGGLLAEQAAQNPDGECFLFED